MGGIEMKRFVFALAATLVLFLLLAVVLAIPTAVIYAFGMKGAWIVAGALFLIILWVMYKSIDEKLLK